MDPTILADTEKYAKTSVTKKVIKLLHRDPSGEDPALKKKIIYVAEPTPSTESWRAVLIDSATQAGKTRKCFEILNEKVKNNVGNTLVLFVTQANNTASVSQILQRAPASADINNIIPSDNIYRSGDAPDDVTDGNYMLVDFWHSKNMDQMLDFVKRTTEQWDTITIVIDEIEQAGQKGVKQRLSFVRKVEKAASYSIVNVIFITATTANLSKCILKIAKDDLQMFNTGVVADIVSKPVVEHHYATPHDSYVGASWFKNTPNVWKRLSFPKRDPEMTKDDYNNLKQDLVLKEIKQLPKAAKELSLIVTSTRTDAHARLAERLYRMGYNVTVQLNGEFNKNYKVNYIDQSGSVSTWVIPYSQLDNVADKGNLETYRNDKKKVVHTNIFSKDDYSLPHILQAALFMMTNAEERIRGNISDEEFRKLEVLSNAISNLDKKLRRPNDYPESPRVALIAGHLAGRGITIQNPLIDFTCTSFCFTETRDTMQRGATNTQRFGRACGMLADVFARQGRQPILIATEGIVKDAVANELAVIEKAEEFPNGSMINLKDLVTQKDWERMMTKVKRDIKRNAANKDGPTVDGVNIDDLKRYFKSNNLLVGKMIRFLFQQNNPITFEEFKVGINYTKSDKQFQNNLDTGRGINSVYGKLWIVDNKGYILLNKSIRQLLV